MVVGDLNHFQYMELILWLIVLMYLQKVMVSLGQNIMYNLLIQYETLSCLFSKFIRDGGTNPASNPYLLLSYKN